MMNAISRYARRQAMDVPVLYRIWFEHYSRRVKKNVKLPSPPDSLYLDGFPRSGNTYFTAAVSSVFPELTFANHRHCLAPLKIAVARRIPSFVLMRTPKHAIASRFLHIKSTPGRMQALPKDELLIRLVNDWGRYYSYCEQNLSSVSIIRFEDAVANPYTCLRRIAESIGLDEASCDEKRFRDFHRQFREHDRTKKQGSTSYPDEVRSNHKKAIIPLIERSREYGEIISVYNRLRSRAMVIK